MGNLAFRTRCVAQEMWRWLCFIFSSLSPTLFAVERKFVVFSSFCNPGLAAGDLSMQGVQYSFIFDLDLTHVSQAAGAWHVWVE